MDTFKPVSFPKLTQSRLMPIQIHGRSELGWVSFWKTTCFQGSHFVWGEGRVVVMVVFVGGSVGVLMRFVWRSLGVGSVVLGGGGCVFCWCWCEFWTSGIVHLHVNTHYMHEYSVLNSIWPKSGLSELWKNTLQLSNQNAINFVCY